MNKNVSGNIIELLTRLIKDEKKASVLLSKSNLSNEDVVFLKDVLSTAIEIDAIYKKPNLAQTTQLLDQMLENTVSEQRKSLPSEYLGLLREKNIVAICDYLNGLQNFRTTQDKYAITFKIIKD